MLFPRTSSQIREGKGNPIYSLYPNFFHNTFVLIRNSLVVSLNKKTLINLNTNEEFIKKKTEKY